MRMFGVEVNYTLTYHPSVKTEGIPKLDRKTAERIKQAIETRLLAAPQEYGDPLRRTLKGHWKLRVGDWRVIYRVQGDEILILGIIHRKEVYPITEKNRVRH